eukprot:4414269-Amphidinium_carterae.1
MTLGKEEELYVIACVGTVTPSRPSAQVAPVQYHVPSSAVIVLNIQFEAMHANGRILRADSAKLASLVERGFGNKEALETT